MSLADNNPILTLSLHPDALFDEPYRDVPLDVSGYSPLAGPIVSTDVGETGFKCTTQSGAWLSVEACTPYMLRVRIAPDGAPAASATESLGLIPSTWPGAKCCVSGESSPSLTVGELSITVDAADLSFRIANGDKTLLSTRGGLRFSDEPGEFSGHRFLGTFDLANERVFGFGGRIMPPDRTGTSADMFAMKVGSFSGDYGGFPIPWFISTQGYGVFLNNPWPHVYFDMGKTQPDQWFVHAPGGEFDLFFIHGPAFRDIVSRFTEVVGRVPEPRRWWMGFWCSSLSFSSTDEVVEIARRLRREGYPADAMVLDGPWRGGPDFLARYMSEGEYPTNDLNWHPDFGDGGSMISELNDLGFKTVLHQNSRSFQTETIASGLASGVLRREGHEVVVRFGDSMAEIFYRSQLAPRHAEGVSLWWLDHGDRVGGELSPGIPSRNLFGAVWGLATQAAGIADGLEARLSLLRGAGIGGQRSALPWPGDTRFGVDYFAEDIWFCLNAGLSGFPITSADLGGFYRAPKNAPAYNTAFDEDNIARRLCQSIFFLPVPRMHADDSELPKLPWNCPPRTRRLYRNMLELRYGLTPYFYHYALNAACTGEPILRPLVYHHQDETACYGIGDVFYIGESLLVAPVTGKGQTERAVYLPEGTWWNFWTSENYVGPTTITVPTPLYEREGLPIFVKAGAILPSQPATCCQTDEIPQILVLDIYPGASSTMTLLEATNTSNKFAYDHRAQSVSLENATTTTRLYTVRLHGCTWIARVVRDGSEVPATDIAMVGDALVVQVIIAPGATATVTFGQ